MRKQFDAAAYNFKVATPFFSNKGMEFAHEWRVKENNFDYPTPRQVVEGVARFFDVQIDTMLRGYGRNRIRKVQSTYRKVI